MSAAALNPEKFSPFHIHNTSYKTVNEHPIGVDVLIPKKLEPGTKKHPLIVRFHGGFFVLGASLLPLFFRNWVLELALLNDAIIVSADYRLIPEATGVDILADLSDLWKWVHNDLQSFVFQTAAAAPQIDFAHTLVVGDSAGGWLAVQSALMQPAGSIKGVICHCPMLDIRDHYYSTKLEKQLFGMPLQPAEIVDAHVATMTPGAVVTSALPPTRSDIMCSIVRNGRILDFFGDREELFPVEMLAVAEHMPAVLILHGKEDSAVPVGGSEQFVKALTQKLPKSAVRLDVRPRDHGFDGDATLQEEWLKDDADFITGHWLGSGCKQDL